MISRYLNFLNNMLRIPAYTRISAMDAFMSKSVGDHQSGTVVGCYGDVTRAWIAYRALARSAKKIVGP